MNMDNTLLTKIDILRTYIIFKDIFKTDPYIPQTHPKQKPDDMGSPIYEKSLKGTERVLHWTNL